MWMGYSFDSKPVACSQRQRREDRDKQWQELVGGREIGRGLRELILAEA